MTTNHVYPAAVIAAVVAAAQRVADTASAELDPYARDVGNLMAEIHDVTATWRPANPGDKPGGLDPGQGDNPPPVDGDTHTHLAKVLLEHVDAARMVDGKPMLTCMCGGFTEPWNFTGHGNPPPRSGFGLHRATAVLDMLDAAGWVGPRQPEARVWSMPEEPGPEVEAVRDRDGFVWRREAVEFGDKTVPIWRRSTGAWSDDFGRLLAKLGPLAEVSEATP